MKDPNKFGEVTTIISQLKPQNVMVIWLDFVEGEDSFTAEAQKPNPKFVSAPYVQNPIYSSNVEISG